jgi:hypothetical protein
VKRKAGFERVARSRRALGRLLLFVEPALKYLINQVFSVNTIACR